MLSFSSKYFAGQATLIISLSIILSACGGGGSSGGSSGGGVVGASSSSSLQNSSSSSAAASSLSTSSLSSSVSSSSIAPIAVKKTSYLNKNVDVTFSIYDLLDGWDSVARRNGVLNATEAVGLHATAYADFQQNGSYSLISNTSYLLQYDNNGKPLNGKIIATDMSGNDITKSLIHDTNLGCVHPRKALVADFNNDEVPDVFFSCTGDDIPTTPGETSLVVLSSKGLKYSVFEVPVTELGFAHGASAADIDGDGNIDIVLADSKFNDHAQSLRVLMGDGNGAFSNDTSRIDMEKLTKRNAAHANYYNVELIEIDSRLYLLAGGNEIGAGEQSDGDKVPTVMAPFKNGFIDYENVRFLPSVQNSNPLDFVRASTGNIFVLRTTHDSSSLIIQKIAPDQSSSVLFTHSGQISIKSPGSWIPFFEIANDKIFSVNEDVNTFLQENLLQ